jgi:hypothetical protein
MSPTPTPPDLIALATHPDHNAITRFGKACSELSAEDLMDGYDALSAKRHNADHV